MAKDTFYFQHDYNARNDKKIAALVREFKSAGYGIFWCTAEMMHEEGGQVEFDDLTISAISKDLNENFDLVKNVLEKCVSAFKLFTISKDNILTANRVKRNLDKRKEISEKRSKAGKSGANAKQMQANAKQVPANAQQKQAKERKGKEIKGKKGNKGFNTMPLANQFNGIPEIKRGAVIQLFKISKQTDVSHTQVSDLWEIFKIQNLNGKKYYADEDAVYSHFINWSKTQNVAPQSEKHTPYREKTKEEIDKEVEQWLNEE